MCEQATLPIAPQCAARKGPQDHRLYCYKERWDRDPKEKFNEERRFYLEGEERKHTPYKGDCPKKKKGQLETGSGAKKIKEGR